jgi:hypothetical protein
MEYEGRTEEVVASGMIGGNRGSTTKSCTGSGTGAGLGAAFFFLGFLPMAAAPPPPAQQQQHKAIRRSHCQVLK